MFLSGEEYSRCRLFRLSTLFGMVGIFNDRTPSSWPAVDVEVSV